MALLQPAGPASEDGETPFAVGELGARESLRLSVGVPLGAFSALGLRCVLVPLGIAVSRPGPGETGVLVFGEGEVLKG